MCVSHTLRPEPIRDANLLGAAALAIAERLPTAGRDVALVALASFLDGGSIEALARVLGVSHSGAVRLVDRLVADGFVQRRDGADGRSVAVTLTDAGGDEAARLAAAREHALLDLLAPLGEAQRRALTAVLEPLLAGLVTERADAGHLCRLCDADACGHPDRCPVTNAY